MRNNGIFSIIFLMLFYSFALGDVCAGALTLSQGLQLVIQNNRAIKITQREEAISEADALLARSTMLPNINASLGQTFFAYQPAAIFGFQSVPMSEKSFHSYSLNVQQILYDFRGSASRYEASRVVLKTKELDTIRVRNLVALDFTIIYFDLLESEKLVIVAEKEVQRLESHLNDAKNLYEAGVITKNDLLQAEVRLSDARQKMLSARNLRAINTARLNNALARTLSEDTQVMDVAETPSDSMDLDREKIEEIAMKQRPEIQIMDETMKALNLNEISKKSEYYPRLVMKGSYDFTENRYQVHEGNWSLTLGMSINLFGGGSTKADLLKIENQKLRLVEQKARTEDEIRLEVEKYILDLKNAWERMRVTKDAIGQAEENLRINKIKYHGGVGTATDVLDAVTLLSIADTNYYRALYDFRRAEAAFLYSTGKDLSEVYK